MLLTPTLHMNFILVSLIGIHLLSHTGIYLFYRGKFYVCACGLCSLNEDVIKLRFCSIRFTVILAGLKKIVCYTEDFVI